ncbi:phosphatase PAP2 family protein [Oceanobacillus senegalensis]|uniref:phosphatase PAP2 family protein n=1 Tax=Oceanobacillus senegalensis TaxID=1936063 RepID=UPI001FECBB94|nr:phosphatase PAP2 family protein [Oceanobacillus senegalensis]
MRNVLWSFFVVVLFTIGIWIIQIINGYVPFIDQWTRNLAESLGHTNFYTIFLMITNLGSRHFLVPIVIVMAITLGVLYKNLLLPVLFSGGTLLTYELNKWIKDLIQRERPTILEQANAIGNSFPSGHAMISMVCYGLFAYFLARKIKSRGISLAIQFIFSFIVFLIGISRYIINVHYLTDVFAGFTLGFICLIGLIYLYEKLTQWSVDKNNS